jgi:hypothetical protein
MKPLFLLRHSDLLPRYLKVQTHFPKRLLHRHNTEYSVLDVRISIDLYPFLIDQLDLCKYRQPYT